MAQSEAELCSRALALVGVDPISSLADQSIEAATCAALLPPFLYAALADHPWNFATRKWHLSKLSEAPAVDWTFAYALPPAALRPLVVGAGDTRRGVDYEVVGNQVHTDADDAVMAGVAKVTVQELPPFFEYPFIIAFAAELCLPLTENTQRTELLAQRGELAIRRARLIDAQMQPARGISDFPLLQAHR